MKKTMLIQNTIGVTVLRYITLIKLEDLGDQVIIRYKMKGGRKVNGYRISKKDTQLVIANGWQSIASMKEDKRGQFTYDTYTIFNDGDFLNAKNELVEVEYSHEDAKEL